ncbi:phosphatidate cytidylyltransferase [Lactobacillus sp. S2-2]|uniref:phosphatidate cytidylyltransferase n=1 Tax=Lactobacillus sp. S2-2 TaxID=2692917 RepID=UPI001F3BE0A6|nr:phosphatidate cytidylyltransferase [Lactobacillus sp. S2-2]MCF6514944.1 phosphatidate cytidylyltransferase [Lactobacillus sp. S2-2]
MKQRILTAIIALIIFIPLVVAGGVWIQVTGIALGLIAFAEILIMKKRMILSMEALISYVGVILLIAPNNWLPSNTNVTFTLYLIVILLLLRSVFSKNHVSFDDIGTMVLGIMYVGYGFHYFISARTVGLDILFYALLIVWITDSGAYFFGRQFGKHKLAPSISPNKTWEGSIGGSLFATIICVIYISFFPIPGYSLVTMIIITLILSIFGQIGDLVESSIKRFYGVKDSGKILPGHGGILDRFDSLLFVLPLLHLFQII